MAALPRMFGGRAVLLVVLCFLLTPLLAESTGSAAEDAAAARREQLFQKVRAQVDKILQKAIRQKRNVVRIRVGFKVCSTKEAQPEIQRRITEAVDSGNIGGFTTEPGSTRFGNLEYYAAYRLTMRFHDDLRNETSLRYTAVKEDIFVNASSELALVRGLAKVDLDEFRPGFFSTFAILKISAPHYAATRTRDKYNSFVSSGVIGPRLLDPNYTYFSSARPPRFEAIADLAFILDNSDGVTQFQFEKILNFTNSVVDYLDVGSGAVRVTVFTVSSRVWQHFALDSFSTPESVTEAIGNIQNMALVQTNR
uniref:VWFA domain-containing protein n=1 Tax=Branchiostoma floridae TaxID=7739 RepID=C3Z855_BRAFL|eukprot:XP_002595168.1 hypothetical protein BRAFLDRAFT_110272 [Branchiostoma floridae]